VFQAAAKALKPDGLFGFTLEDAGDEAPDWRLNPNARYTHARSYVEGALATAGLAVHSISCVILRKEDQKPVAGHLVVARKLAVEEEAVN
jgi:predicted TPR repeat methyltransferase